MNSNKIQMNSSPTNIFIIDDNAQMVSELVEFLKRKFSESISVSSYYSSLDALKNINAQTDIVIMDVYLEGNKGNELIEKIKKINPQTEVIMLTSNEHVSSSIEAFKRGADQYIVKGENSRKNLLAVIYDTLGYPIRVLIREFGVSKYLAIFILTFISVGIVAFFLYKTKS
jgi:DNA-binding NarL/FixJ family response regulator